MGRVRGCQEDRKRQQGLACIRARKWRGRNLPRQGALSFHVDVANRVLMLHADQDVGGLAGGSPKGQRLGTTAFDEPDDARGQR